jgi:hypothetical protein
MDCNNMVLELTLCTWWSLSAQFASSIGVLWVQVAVQFSG